MSTLAKAFVVIVLLLSVLVAVATMGLFAQRLDWRTKAEDANKEKATLSERLQKQEDSFKSQLAQKNEKIRQLNTSYEDKTHEVQLATGQRDEKAGQLKESETKLTLMMTENAKLSDVSKMQAERILTLEELTENLKAEKEKAFYERQQQFNKAVELERQLSHLDKKYKEAEKIIRDQRGEIARPKGVAVEKRGVAAPTVISGRVREKTESLVAISVGSDDGVKKDYLFHIFRGGTYLGDLIVTNVYPDMSVGEILKEVTRDPNNIRKGDNVTTKFEK